VHLLGVTLWKPLVIESFSQSKPNKSKHKTILEFGGFFFGVVGKPLASQILIEFIS